MKLAVVMITYNEELHIARAIESIERIADEIFVVDSYSGDATVEIAAKYGAEVTKRKFISHSDQFQWALDHLGIKSQWIMRLDADEYIDAALGSKIRNTIDVLPSDVTGINLRRRHIFMGRWIRHGGRYPVTLLRIWRAGTARVEQRWMDEHIVLNHGRAVTIDGVFADHNLQPLSHFIAKHNSYSSREAFQTQLEKFNAIQHGLRTSDKLSSGQAKARRFLKNNLYNKLSFPIAALGYFLLRYIFQFGFLDGREGLIYHFLQGFWYRFLVGAKILEMEMMVENISDIAQQRLALLRLAGISHEPASKANTQK